MTKWCERKKKKKKKVGMKNGTWPSGLTWKLGLGFLWCKILLFIFSYIIVDELYNFFCFFNFIFKFFLVI
jgi:hypothetical protein